MSLEAPYRAAVAGPTTSVQTVNASAMASVFSVTGSRDVSSVIFNQFYVLSFDLTFSASAYTNRTGLLDKGQSGQTKVSMALVQVDNEKYDVLEVIGIWQYQCPKAYSC